MYKRKHLHTLGLGLGTGAHHKQREGSQRILRIVQTRPRFSVQKAEQLEVRS